jgi:CheY-like chemotaxis protein
MSQSQSSHTPTRVLVAEDNKINQKIVKELLRKEGFEAYTGL